MGLTVAVWLAACTGTPSETAVPIDSDDSAVTVDTSEDPPPDADGDGFDARVDCNDADPAIHPGAVEACDDVDNDCDGLVDDADGDVDGSTAIVAYPDADDDDYGASDLSEAHCDLPEGWSLVGGDCDDASPSVHPGVSDACDGVDEDCDGTPDDDCPPAPRGDRDLADYTTLITGDGVLFGLSVAALGDIDADTYPDVLVGSQAENAGVRGAGAAWIIRGPVTAAMSLAGAEPLLRGTAKSERVGHDSIGPGDVDGDGLNDAIVGSYIGGDARLFAGPAADGAALVAVLEDASSMYVGERGVAGLGDWNSDGLADVVVGDQYASPDPDHYAAGAAYVYTGPLAGTLGAGDADATLLGEYELQKLGFSVAGIGDVDADGAPDLAVRWEAAFGPAYTVAIHYGPFTGSRLGSDADALVQASTLYDDTSAFQAASWSPVLEADDMDADGDGRTDLLLSGVRHGSGGTAYLFMSGVGASHADDADVILTGVSSRSAAVRATWIGDLDQDGNSDLATADDGFDGTTAGGTGEVYLFYGPFAAGVRTTATADAVLHGGEIGALAGYTIAAGGELTGDVYPDLVVSAPGETLGGTADGVAWIIPGGP